MGMNDAQEKLDQAKEWLTDPNLEVLDPKFQAAWEHVMWVYHYSYDPELKAQATQLMANIMGRNWLN